MSGFDRKCVGEAEIWFSGQFRSPGTYETRPIMQFIFLAMRLKKIWPYSYAQFGAYSRT